MTTKYRLAVPPNSEVHGAGAPKVTVLKTSPGLVTVLDQVKVYYKGLITLIGVVLLVLNDATPVLDFIPGPVKGYVTVAVGILTTLSAFLVANQHWVDDA